MVYRLDSLQNVSLQIKEPAERSSLISPARTGAARRKERIRVLRAADQRPAFHKFLALPAELRNDIYQQAFGSGDSAHPGSTEILLTCKRVYYEASEILYNSICINVEVTCYGLRCRGKTVEAVRWSKNSSDDFRMIHWPTCLRGTRRIRLQICEGGRVLPCRGLIHVFEPALWSLCDYLSDNDRLRVLTLQNNYSSTRPAWKAQTDIKLDLSPIRLLSGLRSVEGYGIHHQHEGEDDYMDIFPSNLTSAEQEVLGTSLRSAKAQGVLHATFENATHHLAIAAIRLESTIVHARDFTDFELLFRGYLQTATSNPSDVRWTLPSGRSLSFALRQLLVYARCEDGSQLKRDVEAYFRAEIEMMVVEKWMKKAGICKLLLPVPRSRAFRR